MSDYFEERKSESQEKEEKELADKKRYVEMRQKYAGRYDDRYQSVKKTTIAKKLKPVKKPKLTVAQKVARSAKRKRTIKKVYKAVQRFIYGKPKAKRKTTTKRKSTKKK